MTPFDLAATWREHAACSGLDPNFDPPTDHTPDEQARIHRAATICRTRCTVTAECLLSARQHHDSGVRGGLLLADGVLARPVGRPAVEG